MEEDKIKLKNDLIEVSELLLSHAPFKFNQENNSDLVTNSELHFSYTDSDTLSAWYSKSYISKSGAFRDIFSIVSFDNNHEPFMLITKHRDTGLIIFNMDKSQIDSIILNEDLNTNLDTNLTKNTRKAKL